MRAYTYIYYCNHKRMRDQRCECMGGMRLRSSAKGQRLATDFEIHACGSCNAMQVSTTVVVKCFAFAALALALASSRTYHMHAHAHAHLDSRDRHWHASEKEEPACCLQSGVMRVHAVCMPARSLSLSLTSHQFTTQQVL